MVAWTTTRTNLLSSRVRIGLWKLLDEGNWEREQRWKWFYGIGLGEKNFILVKITQKEK